VFSLLRLIKIKKILTKLQLSQTYAETISMFRAVILTSAKALQIFILENMIHLSIADI